MTESTFITCLRMVHFMGYLSVFMLTNFLQIQSYKQEALGKEILSLFFNLAIKSPLWSIWSSLIPSFAFHRLLHPGLYRLSKSSPSIKVLAYADDAIVFPMDLTKLQTLL